MISSDDVRLLRPVRPGSGAVLGGERPGLGATAIPPGLVVATTYTLTTPAAPVFASWFDAVVAPRLVASGAGPLAVFETEPSANTFPRLPVREGEHAFVWLARYEDVAAYDRHVAVLAADRHWRDAIRPALECHLAAPADVWRLTPTARSRTVR